MSAQLNAATRAFLSEPNVAMLATVSPEGRPQATPIWFMLEDDHILVNTSKGRVKLRNLEANPYLALAIVDPKDMYRYIQIQGRVARIDHANGASDIDHPHSPASHQRHGAPLARTPSPGSR